MFSVATPDMQLFAISTSKVTEENLNNLLKQEIYKIQNSECAWTHPIEKTKSICNCCKCLSGYKVDLFTLPFMFCINIIHYFKVR